MTNDPQQSQQPDYPPARVQYYGPPVQEPDNSRKFLNMSAATLALVITGVIVVCCAAPLMLCLFGPVIRH